MSALGIPVLINSNRSYWLSSIGTDVVHSTIITGTIDASGGNFSTMNADKANISTLNVSSFNLQTADVSGMYVSSIRGNTGFFSSLSLASDLSGGVGYVRFSVDASGIQVDGDPIRFDNLVYLTSSINIIQVSTLVDTDIFGSNGYFSSFSTGSLSTGFASLLQANISSLYVSSLEGFDISGAQPVEWSLYPTLNSSITFNPGYVLSNVSQKLYFAGQEITDLSGGGANWSQFPALYDVSMNDFSLRAVSTIQFQDSATLTSQTGNNLFYNGQPIQYGSASNVSQWANYPAVNNVTLNGRAISTNGNLVMNVASNVSTSCQDFYVMADNGVNIASVADLTLVAQNGNKGRINLTANPGFNNGVFGEINLTANGGSIGGVGSGGLITLNANTPAGFSNLTSAVKISGAGVNSYAGVVPNVGSLAGYNFIYGSAGVNICSGLPPAFPNIPLTTYLYGTAGVTTSSDFYCPTIQPYWNGLTTPPDLLISGRTVNLQPVYVQLSNVKYLYMQGAGQIQNANLVSSVSTIGSVANFGLGQFTTLSAGTGNVNTLNANTISTGFIQAPLVSTININLSTINGVDWQDISGGVFTTISSFNYLQTSSFKVSTMSGTFGNNTLIGSTIFCDSGIQFTGETTGAPGGNRFLSSLRLIQNTRENLDIYASTMNMIWSGGINPTGYFRIGEGGAFDSYVRSFNGSVSYSTPTLLANSTITQQVTTSSIGAYGGLPIKVNNVLEFATMSALDNVDVINLNPLAIPQLNIGASTINLGAVNTFTQSLSTIRHSTSALSFSTATSVGSNTAYNYPIFIDYDQAGNMTNLAGVAIAVQGHNFSQGAVVSRIEMGARGNGENYIMSVWPGQNLEDLFIEATQVTIRDSDGFSTIINENPYGVATNGVVKIGAGSEVVMISTNSVKVGGVNQMTGTALSSVIINTPYGNNLYYAGNQQPCIFHGTTTLPSGGAVASTLISLPTAYTTKDFDVQLTYKNSYDNTGIYWSTQTSGSFLAFGGQGKILSWTTLGALPFTG